MEIRDHTEIAIRASVVAKNALEFLDEAATREIAAKLIISRLDRSVEDLRVAVARALQK